MSFLFVSVLAVVMCGCSPGQADVESSRITVFAGAGTAPVMNRQAEVFTEETGIRVIYNYANAAQLAKQLEAGTPADVFLSANRKWMNYAVEKGCINTSTCSDLLTTDLVIIVPKGRPVDVDFCQPRGEQKFSGRFAIGDPGFSPLGIYAEQSFRKLGWWDELEPHFVTADTINKVLHYVELSEADAGVVFRSVAALSDNVDVVGVLPANTHKPVRFPVAECRDASPLAVRFIDFLKSPKAADIFTEYGWKAIGRSTP